MTKKFNKKIYIVYINNNFFYEKLHLDFIRRTQNISKVISIPSKQKLNLKKLLYYYCFYNFKGFLFLIINNLISKFKKDVQNECKKKEIDYSEFKSFEKFQNEILKEKDIDLIISTIDIKIERNLLEIPKDGWLNVHCGDLRKYRGINSPFWTMLNEENFLTMTLHKMGIQYDDGPIIIEKKIVNNKLPFFETIKILFSLASKELSNLLDNYDQMYNIQIIDTKNSKYFTEPKVEESKKFLKKGLKFI
tara:strand:+ start:5242 stop:5985 length:744 start_codon:yes stop_codon:yes gene_type:complete